MAKSKNTGGIERDDWTRDMLQRASDCFSFDSEQRRKVRDDMQFAFVSGHQWDNHLKSKRKNKPCYEFNQLRQLIRRVTGQQLKNKPQIKVRAVEDNDVETAEVYNGLIKNIEVQSAAETAYDTAFQWAAGGGYGVLRVVSEYESDRSFDQCLKIKTVNDPLTVWCDPGAREFDRSDARYWFVTEVIPKSEFKRRWPNKPMVDFSATGMDELDQDWWFEDGVRIAEYWHKKPKKKTIHLLTDGTVVDAEEFDPIAEEQAAQGLLIKSSREVEYDEIYSVPVCGTGMLEEPTKWGGSMFPFVIQWGDFLTIDGKQIYSGMTRFARDAQTIHNFEMSSLVEVVAKLPNNPLKATPTMIKGLESYYERLGYDDPPVLLYNADPAAPSGSPQREPMSQLPTSLVQLAGIATDELKMVTGVYDASIGARSNETSGRAILARQNEGETANFVYTDNQVKALKRLGEILVDAIPHYYDAERSIRILGDDNAEKYIKINRPTLDEQTGEVYIVNDLSRGRYDVTVTVGRSFDTARMELAEAAQALSQQPGPFGMLGQLMLMKSLDVPGMDEFVKAARQVVVNAGLLKPGEGDDPPPAPEPNPKDVADAEQKAASAKLNNAKAEGQQLQNVADAQALQLAYGSPPPEPMPQPMPMNEPPQGGFFMAEGMPPQ